MPSKRGNIIDKFSNPAVQKSSMEVNLKVIETYDLTITDLERTILKLAQYHDPVSYALHDFICCTMPL